MLSVNSNYSSLFAANAARNTQNLMDKSVERLSTGMRINSAKDDAAGLAISMRLNAEIQGLAMASRNAADGQSMIDTAEGALQEVTSLLLRARELAVQSANGTLQDTDRTSLQAEFISLTSEIDSIASKSSWGGLKLLYIPTNGFDPNELTFQIGAKSGETITHSIPQMLAQSATMGLHYEHSVGRMENAVSSISAIDGALSGVSKVRGELGSTSNRLEHAIANLDQIRVNLSTSKGRIEDADFAVETGNLAKSQILQQAATAMLAQANASKGSILALVQL